MNADVETIQALAEEYRQMFTTKERDGETIWVVRDDGRVQGGTAEAFKLIAAHESPAMLPDDYRYAFTVEALDLIAESDDPWDVTGIVPQGVDALTHNLVRWLGSGERFLYVNEAVNKLGHSEGLGVIGDIYAGQALERREVYDAVLSFLEARRQAREEQER